MRVFVYYNLHKKLWSVKNIKTGRVIAHTKKIQLKDVVFKVSKAGRERVLREQRKNVHAGVVGTIIEDCEQLPLFTIPTPVTYNPYKYESFVTCLNKQPIHKAKFATMNVEKAEKVVANVEFVDTPYQKI